MSCNIIGHMINFGYLMADVKPKYVVSYIALADVIISLVYICYNIHSYNIILITVLISISYFFPVIPSTPDLFCPYMLLPISIPNH